MNVIFSDDNFNAVFHGNESLYANLEQEQTIDVSFAEGQPLATRMDSGTDFVCRMVGEADNYEGAYSVTPSSQAQTLRTANKILEQDIVVEPIPSNYGLVTWNGSALMIS